MFFLGGHTIVGAGWTGYRGVRVDFVSQFTAGWFWQLYANRTLIGRTSSPTQRSVIGQLIPSTTDCPLTLVRVDPGSVLVDYGDRLPDLPWNRFGLDWSAESYPADSHHFEITGSRVADGPVDSTNLLANVPFAGDGAYSFILPPITDTGEWSYSVTSRDDALPLGNAGTVQTVSIDALVPPPDFTPTQRGNRFRLLVEDSVIITRFTY